MVKALWAVACSVFVIAITLASPAFAEESSPAGATPTISQSAEPVDAGYKLGPEDQLRISVWDNKDLTLDLVVRPDGKISMPLIQDVVAEGLTAVQLADEIKKKLSSFVVNPEVSVIVLQVNSPKYYMMGYITRPGTYPLRGEVSVLQALALAGGFTQFASPRSIKLIRNESGRQEIRKINFYNLLEDGGKGNYILKPGDTIVVP